MVPRMAIIDLLKLHNWKIDDILQQHRGSGRSLPMTFVSLLPLSKMIRHNA